MEDNSLKPLIEEEVRLSLKKGDKERTTTLRMAVSEIKKEEINKKSDLENAESISILEKMIKQRKDSKSQFSSAGREDLANKEGREIKILSEFLPDQLSQDEINLTVKETIEDLNAESIKDIGKVISSLKTILQGKADMSLVSTLVKENLTK